MIRRAVADRADRTAVALDWLPVLVVPPVLVLDAALYSRGGPITVVTVLSAVAASLPLVLRRRVSFIILAPLMTAGIILVLWQLRPSSTVVLIPMIGLFELALNGDRRRSLTMAAAVVPFVFAGVVPFTDGHSLLSILIRNLALCLLAIAAGDVLRSRQVSAQRSELAREQETLRRLSDERLLIAREIHDVVAHAMTAINVQAGVAAHLLRRDPSQAYDALRAIKQTSGEALSELRATLDVLRDPGAGAPVAPTASLRELEPLTEGVRAAGVAVELDVGPVSDLPAAVQGAGYRIVQEALTNIARHADARTATVRVRRLDGAVTIEIDDDGHGAHAGTAIGNGVRGMRERAVALGGTLEAAPGRSGGWRVRASLPLPAQNGGSAA
jgi:signal transduction histidine kinase